MTLEKDLLKLMKGSINNFSKSSLSRKLMVVETITGYEFTEEDIKAIIKMMEETK